MSAERVHVVAGALIDADGRVLLARRPDRAHQGGRWEFPGGKLEPGEARLAGLARELREEIGVEVEAARPLIAIDHDYEDRAVRLDVWRVDAWLGTPVGREGQPIAWSPAGTLAAEEFPAADVPVLAALALPDRYLVTPEPGPDRSAWLAALERSLARGVRLVQVRAKTLDDEALAVLAREALSVCRAAGARLLVNGAPEVARAIGADGVHLPAARAGETAGLAGAGLVVGVSCHDADALARAARAGAAFAVLGPVLETASHPGAAPLGWERFERFASGARLPVYALGGMTPGELATAWERGAQGVAAIRGLWG